jgi:hypothetical protein
MLLIACGIVLGVAALFAFASKLASKLTGARNNITAAAPRDAAVERAEAIATFSNFTAADWKAPTSDPRTVEERAAVVQLFDQLETAAVANDPDAVQKLVDFDRLVKRMDLSGNLAKWNQLERRYIRTELKNATEALADWKSIRLAGIVPAIDDSRSRIVYAYCKDQPDDFGEESQYRFWIAREGERWVLYDWERLDYGMAHSQEWSLYCKYHNTSEIAAYERWSELVQESDALAAAGKTEEAKGKLRLAEVQKCPLEFDDYHWLMTGLRWQALGSDKEALDCYASVDQPDDTPGVYHSRMVIDRWDKPADALKHAEHFEAALGPSSSILAAKAALQNRLQRPQEAVAEWKKLLRIKPDHTTALAEVFLSLPEDGKPAFDPLLSAADDPQQTAANVAEMVGRDEFASLPYFVDYLQRTAPDAPAAAYVAGLTKSYDGQYAAAAEDFRRAFAAEQDEDQRSKFVGSYLEAMTATGNAAAAIDIVPKPEESFEYLFLQCDEGEISLTRAEYRQLLKRYAEMFPNKPDASERLASQAYVDKRFGDAERIARQALSKLPDPPKADEPSANKESESPADDNAYYRSALRNTLAAALVRQGKLAEALSIDSDEHRIFQHVAQLAVQDRRWEDAAALLAAQQAKSPNDPGLHFLAAEIAVRDRDWTKAIREYEQLLADTNEDTPWRWQWENRLPQLCVRANQWAEYYQNSDDKQEAFAALAQEMEDREKWEMLDTLIRAHRVNFPDDQLKLAQHEASAAWEQEDYPKFLTLAEAVLADKSDPTLEVFPRELLEERRVSALLRSGNGTEALARAREFGQRDDGQKTLACAHAAVGNLAEAQQLAKKWTAINKNPQAFYHHADAGRAFVSAACREMHVEHPVELPYAPAPVIAVFLYDKPTLVEASDVAAAVGALGLAVPPEPRPLEALSRRITRSFSLQLAEGSLWIASGTGKFRQNWTVDDAQVPTAQAVNQSQAWVAVGVAGWSELQREHLAVTARRVAMALMPQGATAACLEHQGAWRQLVAYSPSVDGLAEWKSTGSFDNFLEPGVALGYSLAVDPVENDRRVDRSLRKSVRDFESRPGKFEVWAAPTGDPALDVVRLEVHSVRRSYGELEFDGTLANTSQLIPELASSLPMRFLQSEICAWRVDDKEVLYRDP